MAKSKQHTKINWRDLVDYASDKFFNNWLDCYVSAEDLTEALQEGFENKNFGKWENSYDGKEYEYLECAYDIGVTARSYKSIVDLDAYYNS